MLQKFLLNALMMFDRFYTSKYPNDKNKLVKSLLTDYSGTEIYLETFIKVRGIIALKEMYIIINNFYNSKLSDLITKGDDKEISKLKYLQILLLDIKNTLNTNSD